MRFPWDKVYRAFPELDRFSDAECENYVRIARERYGASRAGSVVLTLLAVVLAVGVLVAVFSLVRRVIPSEVRDDYWDLLVILQLVIYLAAPMLCWLTARDIWLRRAIRRQLFDTLCPDCKYQLLGLPIYHESVQCPECGRRTPLRDFDAAREIFLTARPGADSPIPPVIRPS